jgi:hypothetical protein
MTSTFTHIAAGVAGFLAIVAIGGLTINSRVGLVKNVVAAVAVGVVAALLITAVRAYGAEQKPQKTGVQQADKSQEECIARRQREGLNIRFSVYRCVNPSN